MYIPSLDGIRALAVFLVFVSHTGITRAIPGGFGVTVFFFLSGFLITTLLAREQDKYGQISLRAFYLRRLLRLTPPLVITLGAGVLMVQMGWLPGAVDWPTLAAQVFFYFNYYYLYGPSQAIEGTGVFWSLSVEEHFYIIWPAIFMLIAAGTLRIGAILAALVVILIWRCVLFIGFGFGEEAIYLSTDTRFDSLLYGCFLALLIWRGQAARLFPEGARAGLIIAGAFGLIALSFVWRDPLFRSTLRYSVQGLAFLPLFYYAVSRPDWLLFKPLNWGALRWIGVYSYTIYLVHFMVIKALVHMQITASGSLATLGLAAVLSVGFAAAVYHLIERPLHPMRKRLTGHRPS